PARLADQIRIEVEVDGVAVTIVERRAPWSPSLGPEWSRLPVARLRFSPTNGQWTLFWFDRNRPAHRYPGAPSNTLDDLLRLVDQDSTAIFWG
ncbi:MAG TPA: DUF3024 domain-containing protein, partial [Candidatus Limnocylindrales bacterium]